MIPEELKDLDNKELAKLCVELASNNGMKVSDMTEDACLAHLAEARVFPCGVLIGYSHIKGDNCAGLCCDWSPIPKVKQLSIFSPGDKS